MNRYDCGCMLCTKHAVEIGALLEADADLFDGTGDNICSVCDPLCEYYGVGTVCFACEQRACKNCSMLIAWYNYGIQRICHHCIEDLDGNPKRVLENLEKGY